MRCTSDDREQQIRGVWSLNGQVLDGRNENLLRGDIHALNVDGRCRDVNLMLGNVQPGRVESRRLALIRAARESRHRSKDDS